MKVKHKVGIIGLVMGKRHVDAAIERGVEIAAICDINPDRLKVIGEEYNIPEERRFTDWKELLKIDDMDIAIIVTPDQTHREMSEAFLSAGKHVLCEKPLALTREDLTAIVRAAETANTKFMVGQVARFEPEFAKAKELIDNGVIGEIYYVESEYAHDYAKILHEWRADPLRHGVVGGGCHAVDLLRWIAGDPIEVFAYGSHKLLPQVTYDDATVSILKYPNGVVGKIFVSTGCKRPYTMRTLIYGTKGTIICPSRSDHIELYTLGPDGIAVNPTPEIVSVEKKDHNVGAEFDMFVDHIDNDTPVTMSAYEGAKTIAACFAIVESAKTGVPVKPDYKF